VLHLLKSCQITFDIRETRLMSVADAKPKNHPYANAEKNEVCIWRIAAAVSQICKSSADMCPHRLAHSSSKLTISKRTSTHIPAFYSLAKWGIANQCSCARRFERPAHDLLCDNSRNPTHAPGARAKRLKKGQTLSDAVCMRLADCAGLCPDSSEAKNSLDGAEAERSCSGASSGAG